MEELRFIARRPRHEVGPDVQCDLTIFAPATGQKWPAHLADLSRQGLKVISDQQIPLTSVVEVSAEFTDGSLHLSTTAAVRWCNQQKNGRWASGLIFERELSWEIMGEMFLHGILSIDGKPGGGIAMGSG